MIKELMDFDYFLGI